MAKKNLNLTITEGTGVGTVYRLLGESVVIGRSAECDIPLENTKGVSRRHAQIFVMDDRVRLQDLGSANGTLVEGERVEEAILVPGVTIKIGATSLKLVDADEVPALPSKRKSGGQLQKVEAGLVETGADAAFLPGGVEEADRPTNPRNLSLFAALLIVLVVGGMYVLHVVSYRPSYDPTFRNVMVNESKIVDFGANFARWQVEGRDRMQQELVWVEEYDGLLRPGLTALASNRNAPRRRLVVLRGRSEGDARVTLLSEGGNVIARRTVLVRGQIPRVVIEDIPPQQAYEEARKAAAEAEVLRADGNLYFAWQRLEYAVALLKRPASGVPGALDLESEYASDGRTIKNELQAALTRLFNEAMASAFPADTRTSPVNYNAGIARLQEAKNLIPDETSLDWQVLDHWQSILRRLQVRERQRR